MKTFKEHQEQAGNQMTEWNPQPQWKLDTNPCEGCGGKCCTGMYLDQGPVYPGSYDHMDWARYHEGVEIYTYEHDGGLRWGVKLPGSQCKFLQEDGSCGIYETRPIGCRTYYGMNPDGPKLDCALIKELIRTKQVPYQKEWVEKLWPEGAPPELLNEDEF